MICGRCADRHHEDCRGGSWCDCQHVPAEEIRAFKYGMYVSPAALDPEGLTKLLAELPDETGDDHVQSDVP